MQSTFHATSEIAFAIQTGQHETLAERFNLTPEEVKLAFDLYAQGNDLELVKLAQSKKILTPATKTEELETAATDSPILPAPPKPEYGYKVRALQDNVFIRVIPKDHPGRLTVPPVYETSADMGFVFTKGPDVTMRIKAGDLVLFDKYAETGSKYLLVVDGELTELVRIPEPFIFGILTRVKL